MNAKKTLYLSISLLLSSPFICEIVASESQVAAPEKSKEQVEAIRKGIWAKIVKANPVKKGDQLDHQGHHKTITDNTLVFGELSRALNGMGDSKVLATDYAKLDNEENEFLNIARAEYAKYLAWTSEIKDIQAYNDKKAVRPSATQLALTKRSQDYVNNGSRFWRYAKGTTQPVKFHVDGLSCHAAHVALQGIPAVVKSIAAAVNVLDAKTKPEMKATTRVEALMTTIARNKPYIDKLSALEKEIAAQGLQLNEKLAAAITEISAREASRFEEYKTLVDGMKAHEIEQRRLELERDAAAQTKAVGSMLSSMVVRNLDELKKAKEAVDAKAAAEALANKQ